MSKDFIEPQTRSRNPITSLIRGVAIGVLGVIAIAIWAKSCADLFAGNQAGGPLLVITKLVLCDAVPIATLVAIYRGIGDFQSLEEVLRGILSSIGSTLRFFVFGSHRHDRDG